MTRGRDINQKDGLAPAADRQGYLRGVSDAFSLRRHAEATLGILAFVFPNGPESSPPPGVVHASLSLIPSAHFRPPPLNPV